MGRASNRKWAARNRNFRAQPISVQRHMIDLFRQHRRFRQTIADNINYIRRHLLR